MRKSLPSRSRFLGDAAEDGVGGEELVEGLDGSGRVAPRRHLSGVEVSGDGVGALSGADPVGGLPDDGGLLIDHEDAAGPTGLATGWKP